MENPWIAELTPKSPARWRLPAICAGAALATLVATVGLGWTYSSIINQPGMKEDQVEFILGPVETDAEGRPAHAVTDETPNAQAVRAVAE